MSDKLHRFMWVLGATLSFLLMLANPVSAARLESLSVDGDSGQVVISYSGGKIRPEILRLRDENDDLNRLVVDLRGADSFGAKIQGTDELPEDMDLRLAQYTARPLVSRLVLEGPSQRLRQLKVADETAPGEIKILGLGTTTSYEFSDHLRGLELPNGEKKLRVTAASQISYRSFVLSDPPRLVVDLLDWPTTPGALLAQQHQFNGMIAALRTGIPRERPDAVRLVLDLERADIPHEVKLDDTGRQLDIVLGAKPGPKLRELIAGKKILLDAGHGGRDAGAMYHNVPEKDLNLEIVDKLASKLEEEGLRVVRSRTDDSFVSLSDRVEIAQEEKPLLVISLHSNSLDSVSSVQGIETYYYTPQSKALAVALHDQLVNSTGAPDRRVRKARFVLLRETDIPSVLVEMGFMSNPTELRRLQDPDYQGRIVDGLRNGTLDYLTRQLSPAAKMP